MNAKAQVNTPAKAPAAPAAAHIPRPPVAVPEHEAEQPDMATQLEGAARLGHSFGALGGDGAATPLIQRQEVPEEEEEELQTKREPGALQRQELPEEEEEEELQTKPANGMQRQGGSEGFQLDDETAGSINHARGGGQPLDDALQEQMGEAMGHDFSGVRVHADSEADELNRQLQAKAFTTGPDIFFRRGAYNPGSDSGQELIAHELTHVVQQSSGGVNGDGSGMTVRPAGDAFEQEADNMGREANHEMKNRSQQRATSRPRWPSSADVEALQNTVGNRAVMRELASLKGERDLESNVPAPTKQSSNCNRTVVQRAQWQVNVGGVGQITWYGLRVSPVRAPQQRDFGCWQAALSEALGIDRKRLHEEALARNINIFKEGLSLQQERQILGALGGSQQRMWAQIRSRPQLAATEAPYALACRAHYLVVDAVGETVTGDVYVRYWDPWDNTLYADVPDATLKQRWQPFYGHYKR